MDGVPKTAADARRGWGPWRRDWYSICSRHRGFEPKCALCQHGSWEWLVPHSISSFVYWISPGLWRWWANLPWKKRAFTKKMQGWGFKNFGKRP